MSSWFALPVNLFILSRSNGVAGLHAWTMGCISYNMYFDCNNCGMSFVILTFQPYQNYDAVACSSSEMQCLVVNRTLK